MNDAGYNVSELKIALNGVVVLLAAGLPLTTWAADSRDVQDAFWSVQTSVYTVHYSPDPDHNNHQQLICLERHLPDATLWGAATFKHSFGERANYVYYGKRFALGQSAFHLKLTGGLLEGYKGEYRDKIPLNRFGVAPVIIPSLEATYGRVSSDVVLLGAAAAMVTVSFKL